MKKHLLIIEDDIGLQSFYEKVLDFSGFELTMVETRGEIDLAIQNGSYDLIFCDIELGNENVIDFITDACEQSLPIIVVSANDEYLHHCLRLGVRAFIIKPLLVQDLLLLARGDHNIESSNVYFPSSTI